jgi:SAM-dependent methyltransferase
MTETARRSLDHWSADKRAGMEAFYVLAGADYRHMAAALDWRGWFEDRQHAAGDRPLRLLDVACGSGKFPTALVRDAGLAEAAIRPVAYSLLDPSSFSISEARASLSPPFEPDRDYEIPLERLRCPKGAFDVVWATHALYALPRAELDKAIGRFLHAIADRGVIAHSLADGHYIRFHRHFLDAFGEPDSALYLSAEEIAEALTRQGARFETQEVTYANGAPDSERASVEGFLQRCVFDDTVSLDAMLARAPTAGYLAGCRDAGAWRFQQRVQLFFIRPG